MAQTHPHASLGHGIAVVQEAFIYGVNTRKIERLARAMDIENISASQVSDFNKYLVACSEDGAGERSYIREGKVQGSLDRLHEPVAQAAD
jgi:hypothetical protein